MKTATVITFDDITSFFRDLPSEQSTKSTKQGKKSFFNLPQIDPEEDEEKEKEEKCMSQLFAHYDRVTQEEKEMNRMLFIILGGVGLLWPAALIAMQLSVS